MLSDYKYFGSRGRGDLRLHWYYRVFFHFIFFLILFYYFATLNELQAELKG